MAIIAHFLEQEGPTILIETALLAIIVLLLEQGALLLGVAAQLQWKIVGVRDVGVLVVDSVHLNGCMIK